MGQPGQRTDGRLRGGITPTSHGEQVSSSTWCGFRASGGESDSALRFGSRTLGAWSDGSRRPAVRTYCGGVARCQARLDARWAFVSLYVLRCVVCCGTKALLLQLMRFVCLTLNIRPRLIVFIVFLRLSPSLLGASRPLKQTPSLQMLTGGLSVSTHTRTHSTKAKCWLGHTWASLLLVFVLSCEPQTRASKRTWLAKRRAGHWQAA